MRPEELILYAVKQRYAKESILFAESDEAFESLYKELQDGYTRAWNTQSQKAFADALDSMKQIKGDFNAADRDAVLNRIEKQIGGEAMQSALRGPVISLSEPLFKLGAKDAAKSSGIDIAFGLPDMNSLAVVEKGNMFWIGEHWGSYTGDKVKNTLNQYFDKGMTRDQLAKRFAEDFADITDKGESYWNFMADHTATKTREIGRVTGYEKAGVELVRVRARIDSRTTAVCRRLNDKIISVRQLKAQRDQYFDAIENQDKDAAKKAWELLSDKDVESIKIKGNKVLSDNIGMPPYHGRCRTITVTEFKREGREKTEPETPEHERLKTIGTMAALAVGRDKILMALDRWAIMHMPDEYWKGRHITYGGGIIHHGFCDGKGNVIEYLADPNDDKKMIIHKRTFKDFMERSEKYGRFQEIHHPDPKYSVDESIARAESRIGEEEYSMMGNNCEHFVNWVIEGEPKSEQFEQMGAVMNLIGAELKKGDALTIGGKIIEEFDLAVMRKIDAVTRIKDAVIKANRAQTNVEEATIEYIINKTPSALEKLRKFENDARKTDEEINKIRYEEYYNYALAELQAEKIKLDLKIKMLDDFTSKRVVRTLRKVKKIDKLEMNIEQEEKLIAKGKKNIEETQKELDEIKQRIEKAKQESDRKKEPEIDEEKITEIIDTEKKKAEKEKTENEIKQQELKELADNIEKLKKNPNDLNTLTEIDATGMKLHISDKRLVIFEYGGLSDENFNKLSWHELRRFAKKLGINTFQKKRIDIISEMKKVKVE